MKATIVARIATVEIKMTSVPLTLIRVGGRTGAPQDEQRAG